MVASRGVLEMWRARLGNPASRCLPGRYVGWRGLANRAWRRLQNGNARCVYCSTSTSPADPRQVDEGIPVKHHGPMLPGGGVRRVAHPRRAWPAWLKCGS